MSERYPHLLSPLKIGAHVLKNRLVSTNSLPLFIHGPEPYPSDAVLTHYINKAKSGAAVVTCACGADKAFGPPMSPVSLHCPSFDVFELQCQNYFTQLADTIHFYGAKASMTPASGDIPGYDVCAGEVHYQLAPPDYPPDVRKEISESQLNAVADSYVKQAVLLKELGFDIISIHMAYRGQLQARFLSPLTNKRTDKFGGGIENRAKFPLMVFKKIREACGENFLIEAIVSAVEPEGGITLEDTIAFAKMAEGLVDILQVRAGDITANHPTGFNLEPTPFTQYAQALKESGAKMVISTVGGYQDPGVSDKVIAGGKADLIAMGRCWISNPGYGLLLIDGRSEDIVPCVRCNKCQVERDGSPFHSVCSVNPLIGMEHLIKHLISPPAASRKVAVIGGGPAGMKAAITAANRGHKVTLFEKGGVLGGQLGHTDVVDFKWPLRNYKDYLISRLGKSGAEVRMGVEATPEMIKDEGFDIVLAAIGGEVSIPPIPGIKDRKILSAIDVYKQETPLSGPVAVIGGGEVGVEVGLFLAQKGYKTTILEMRDMLAADAPPVFYRSVAQEQCDMQENLDYILNARCTGIDEDGLVYVSGDGAGGRLQAECIVVAAGIRGLKDEALKFYGSADRFFLIGDCSDNGGNVQKSIRSAFSIASII